MTNDRQQMRRRRRCYRSAEPDEEEISRKADFAKAASILLKGSSGNSVMKRGGNFGVREEPLGRLGYRENGGVYSHPERHVIFGGDLIDRGPAIGETLEIVSAMLRSGRSQIVMGNHEFNALAFHTPDGKGDYLRPHSEKNCSQHSATVATQRQNQRSHKPNFQEYQYTE
jgi:hypothetical protein